ncbi:uncharacterized protein LOC143911317 [Arctopsyche grandis]|uniref:uncharacterized protein LOC143911317 n=1 Tax=Arctopsyche grandis TaxID=121162 RepID=UPI00406D6D45
MHFNRYSGEKKNLNRWNQTWSRTIFLMYFVVIFPVAQSYSDLQKQKSLSFVPRCTTSIAENDFYQIDCDSADENYLTSMLEVEVENFPNGEKTIDFLIIRDLTVKSRKLSQNWINTTIFRISTLYMLSPGIDRIENNAFKGFAFEELKLLRLKDFKTDTLEEGTFEGLNILEQLEILGGEIKHIKENALKAIAPNLIRLTIMEMRLPFNVTNLTGSVPLPKIDVIQFFSNDTSFDAESFSQAGNATYVFLAYHKNLHIGCGTFEKMPSLELLYLNYNRLTTLDSCIFGEEAISRLRENSLSIDFNEWNCDCDLNWLKQLKIENKIYGDARCASHSNLPFEEVNFCDHAT